MALVGGCNYCFHCPAEVMVRQYQGKVSSSVRDEECSKEYADRRRNHMQPRLSRDLMTAAQTLGALALRSRLSTVRFHPLNEL